MFLLCRCILLTQSLTTYVGSPPAKPVLRKSKSDDDISAQAQPLQSDTSSGVSTPTSTPGRSRSGSVEKKSGSRIARKRNPTVQPIELTTVVLKKENSKDEASKLTKEGSVCVERSERESRFLLTMIQSLI